MTRAALAELESDIRRTRARVEQDLYALGEKLSPNRLKQRATALVRHQSRKASGGLLRLARHNPIPAALVGIGLAWMLKSRPDGDGRRGMKENPVIGAARVLVLGAAVGALLPRARTDNLPD